MSDNSGRPDISGPGRPMGEAPRPVGVGLAAALSSATLIACAIPFAAAQSIWSDETTQLAGLTLGPVEVIRWLMGVDADRFGVPSDRMPPLSYWIGWAWGRAFEPGEASMRAMGIWAVAMAAAVVATVAGRLGGPRSALVAGLLFALSPNVVTVAPEIRAYPLFLSFAAWAYFMLVGYARSPDRAGTRWLLGLLVASLAATYTHFFGLVLGGAAIGSAAVLALLGRRRLAWPVLTGVMFLALASGLAPFVKASVNISGDGILTAEAGSFPRLLYRLIGHPAASVDLPVLALMLVGFGGLVAFGMFPRRRGDGVVDRVAAAGSGDVAGVPPGYRLDLMALPIALVLGLVVTFLAGLKVRTFDVYRPGYSIWAIPAVCIVAGSAFAPGLGRRARGLAVACAASALLGSIWAEGVILAHRQVFSHGLQRELVSLIESIPGDRRPVIVFEDDPGWAVIYFPLRFRYGTGLDQYRMTPEQTGPLDRRPMHPLAGTTKSVPLDDLPADRAVVVVRSINMGQAEMRREIRGGGQAVPTGVLMEYLAKSPGWEEIGSLRSFASISAQARVFVRDPGPSKR